MSLQIRDVLFVFPLLLGACGAAAEDDGEGLDTASRAVRATPADPLSVTSFELPHPVTVTDERRHLLYELFLENPEPSDIRLTRLDVFEPGRRLPLATFTEQQLAEVLLSTEGAGAQIAAGDVAIAFLDVSVALRGRLPQRLVHRWQGQREGRSVSVAGPSVPVVRERALRIGPPLRGENVLNANGCCDSGHRRALFLLEDGLFLAQRFAVDLLRAEGLTTFSGDPSLNASFFIYGAEVLAVSAGQVVATRDGIVENVPTEPLPPFDIETGVGNYVVQALEDGHFALYAHLQPGSIEVQPGQSVEPGQVLGLVGNSGNSTEPHLHFHVMDGPSPLASDGLPFVFDDFSLQATTDFTEEGPVVTPVPPPQARAGRLPSDLDLIAFP